MERRKLELKFLHLQSNISVSNVIYVTRATGVTTSAVKLDGAAEVGTKI